MYTVSTDYFYNSPRKSQCPITNYLFGPWELQQSCECVSCARLVSPSCIFWTASETAPKVKVSKNLKQIQRSSIIALENVMNLAILWVWLCFGAILQLYWVSHWFPYILFETFSNSPRIYSNPQHFFQGLSFKDHRHVEKGILLWSTSKKLGKVKLAQWL